MSGNNANTPIFPDQAQAISASDTAGFSPSAIYVGAGGTVVCTPAGGPADVTFVGVPTGSILPVMVVALKATGTTAGSFVRVY